MKERELGLAAVVPSIPWPYTGNLYHARPRQFVRNSKDDGEAESVVYPRALHDEYTTGFMQFDWSVSKRGVVLMTSAWVIHIFTHAKYTVQPIRMLEKCVI